MESTREQWLVKLRVAVSGNNHIFAFGEVFETSPTFWNSFNVRYATFSHFVTLVPHGRLSQKHLPRLLTVVHKCLLSVQRSCNALEAYYGGREVQRLTSIIRHPSSVICHLSSVISFLVGAVMGVACLLASTHVF